MPHPLRDRAAIVGVGYTDFMKNSGVSTLALALRAITAACDDAGISFKDLDGVATHRVNDSVQGAVVLNALGMRDPQVLRRPVRRRQRVAHGGRPSRHGRRDRRGRLRRVLAGHQRPQRVPHGRHRAPATRRRRVPVPDAVRLRDAPAAVRVHGQRVHAAYGAHARRLRSRGDPPTRQCIAQRTRHDAHADHDGRLPVIALDRRTVVPVRLLPRNRRRHRGRGHQRRASTRPAPHAGAGVGRRVGWWPYALLQSPRGPHRHARRPPCRSVSMPWPVSGRPTSTSAASTTRSRPGSGAARGLRVLRQGRSRGVRRRRHGFCRSTRTVVTSRQGYVHGINHIAEAVEQLRGDAGPRQIPGAEVALSTGQSGYVAGSSSALILRKGDRS